MSSHLKKRWLHFISTFTDDQKVKENLWDEIAQYYSEKHRAYHNLNHLRDLFEKFDSYKNELTDLAAIEFTIWYHDIIYNSLSKKNEEKSAELCIKRLQELGLPTHFQQKVFKLICSTKSHLIESWELSVDRKDNAFLLDFDLSILGSNTERYKLYTEQVRQEYKQVPSILYKPGRKKVLQHFLTKDRIFKTESFYKNYEEKARENINNELKSY